MIGTGNFDAIFQVNIILLINNSLIVPGFQSQSTVSTLSHVHTKSECVQTKLTTDTVIPDNVLDLAVGGLQQDNNINLIHRLVGYPQHRIQNKLKYTDRLGLTQVERIHLHQIHVEE